MIVNVQYLTEVKNITDKYSENIHLNEDATVKDLLEILIRTYGAKFRDLIFPHSDYKLGILVALRSSKGDFTLLKNLDIRLSEGDILMIGSQIIGG